MAISPQQLTIYLGLYSAHRAVIFAIAQLSCFMYRGFQQFVNDDTRDNHCIDLVLTNDSLLMSNVNVSAPFSTCDHCMVNFELLMSEHRAEESASQRELVVASCR